MSKKLILLELNEINFDVVEHYIKLNHELKGFEKVFQNSFKITNAEEQYNQLEPWIQWPSIHTGMIFDEHKIFRLGDIVNSDLTQIFEKVESMGFRVGAISPMNTSNNLKDPNYFIPDPWTQTKSDNTFFSNSIAKSLSQAVNDNAQSKLSFKTVINLIIAFFFLINPKKYLSMTSYAISAIKKPWRKALFLDMFLFELHKTLFKKRDTHFSTLFLNAGAHIQHHYFFNSSYVENENLRNPSWYIEKDMDPILEMLKVYNEMLIDLYEMKDIQLIVATGLSQKPYEHLKFYYRLKDHENFLNLLDINYKSVVPRMTRDFLVSFDTENDAMVAQRKLNSIKVNNSDNLFGEIDNRGKDIFVVLTYPHEVLPDTFITLNNKNFNLKRLVSFVAIKNGEHQSKGFASFTSKVSKFSPENYSHVSKIYFTILSFFSKQENLLND